MAPPAGMMRTGHGPAGEREARRLSALRRVAVTTPSPAESDEPWLLAPRDVRAAGLARIDPLARSTVIARLQHARGNTFVQRLIVEARRPAGLSTHGTIQRCGTVACNCSPEERMAHAIGRSPRIETALAQRRPAAPFAQRDVDDEVAAVSESGSVSSGATESVAAAVESVSAGAGGTEGTVEAVSPGGEATTESVSDTTGGGSEPVGEVVAAVAEDAGASAGAVDDHPEGPADTASFDFLHDPVVRQLAQRALLVSEVAAAGREAAAATVAAATAAADGERPDARAYVNGGQIVIEAAKQAPRLLPVLAPTAPVTGPVLIFVAVLVIVLLIGNTTPESAEADRIKEDQKKAREQLEERKREDEEEAKRENRKRCPEGCREKRPNDPCPVPLPLTWPAGLLPHWAEGTSAFGGLVRVRRGNVQDEINARDRGDEQDRLRTDLTRAIKKARDGNRAEMEELLGRKACSTNRHNDPNSPFYDAHHIHPLYLGGDDADPRGLSNVCAIETDIHKLGHRLLDDQVKHLSEYEIECCYCSTRLSKHPTGQEYLDVE